MQTAGIEITGKGESVIQASEIADNPGTGISIREEARPRLDHNLIRHNGHGSAMLARCSYRRLSCPDSLWKHH